MGIVNEDLNLGAIDDSLEKPVLDQFTALYNNLEDQWNQQAVQINVKADVVLTDRSPAATDIRQRGTIWIDTTTDEAWLATSKSSPTNVTWSQFLP